MENPAPEREGLRGIITDMSPLSPESTDTALLICIACLAIACVFIINKLASVIFAKALADREAKRLQALEIKKEVLARKAEVLDQEATLKVKEVSTAQELEKLKEDSVVKQLQEESKDLKAKLQAKTASLRKLRDSVDNYRKEYKKMLSLLRTAQQQILSHETSTRPILEMLAAQQGYSFNDTVSFDLPMIVDEETLMQLLCVDEDALAAKFTATLAELERANIELETTKKSKDRYQDTLNELLADMEKQGVVVDTFKAQLKQAGEDMEVMQSLAAKKERDIEQERQALAMQASLSSAAAEDNMKMLQDMREEKARLEREMEALRIEKENALQAAEEASRVGSDVAPAPAVVPEKQEESSLAVETPPSAPQGTEAPVADHAHKQSQKDVDSLVASFYQEPPKNDSCESQVHEVKVVEGAPPAYPEGEEPPEYHAHIATKKELHEGASEQVAPQDESGEPAVGGIQDIINDIDEEPPAIEYFNQEEEDLNAGIGVEASSAVSGIAIEQGMPESPGPALAAESADVNLEEEFLDQVVAGDALAVNTTTNIVGEGEEEEEKKTAPIDEQLW